MRNNPRILWDELKSHLIFDPDEGEYLDILNGEIYTFEEVREIARNAGSDLDTDVIPGEPRNVTLSEAFDMLSNALDTICQGFGTDWQLVPSSNPNLIVGETDLVAGAGTDNKVIPHFVEEDHVEPNPGMVKFYQSIWLISTALKMRILRNESFDLSEVDFISEYLIFKSQGYVPLGAASGRFGPTGRRVLEEVHTLRSELYAAKQREQDLRKQIWKLNNDLYSLKGIVKSLRTQLLTSIELNSVDKILGWKGKVLKDFQKYLEKFEK